MFRRHLSSLRRGLVAGACGAMVVAVSPSEGPLRLRPLGFPQLVAVEPLPGMEGCVWQQSADAPAGAAATDADRAPVRVLRDTYATYSAVTVDPIRNELILQDENLFQILVFDRTANTPTAGQTKPKRVIAGPKTNLEFNCGLYVDPKTGHIYSVTNDTGDVLTVYSREAKGNVPPEWQLRTPHGTFGIAVDEQRDELYLTVQHENSIVVYRKRAQGQDKPLRTLGGADTQLEDPHGVALDTKNGWLFVSNHGHARDPQAGVGPGGFAWGRGSGSKAAAPVGGHFEPPSITVYQLDAAGNTRPLRVIEGPRTRLNWPAHLSYDVDRQELFVANDVDDSILVFRGTDSGDAAPVRVIKGPKTGIKNPTGVFVDTRNREVVVSNMGNHTATIYARDANGDVAPLRTVRSAPPEKLALVIGNPGAAAYDPKREEILVPN